MSAKHAAKYQPTIINRKCIRMSDTAKRATIFSIFDVVLYVVLFHLLLLCVLDNQQVANVILPAHMAHTILRFFFLFGLILRSNYYVFFSFLT